ncbi:MAG TPA: Mth938-like domain-containing protein [Stellaceae bacterium]|nr:Mth938-like domain-containing protein [Stellaceae bacterium]
MDVTPIIPAGRQVIDSYGPSGFHVSGAGYESAILVFPDATVVWNVASFAEVSIEALRPVIEHGGIRILLLGCGRRTEFVLPALRQSLRGAGIVLDAMDTGAACRTYNILLSEERPVAAALLPAR